MNKTKLIIFDLDGTLFQTQYVTVPAVQQAFTAFGLPAPSKEGICAFFGKPVEAYERWLETQCPPGLASAVVERANALELELIETSGRLYPGVRECLADLAETGYTLAICSNGPDSYVNEVVRAHGLGHFFNEVCARGTCYGDKVEMVGVLLSRLRSDKFMLAGDRREDIEAAHRHNGFAVAATYGFGIPAEWDRADARIQSILEMPVCVRHFFGSDADIG